VSRVNLAFKFGTVHRNPILFFFLLVATLIHMISATASASADQAHEDWKDLRYRGLIEFTKGNYDESRRLFESALASAQNHKPGSRDETLSTYDLAQVYQYMGNRNKESEIYYKRALALAKNSSSDHSPEAVLFMQDLVTLLKSEKRDEEANRIDKETDKIIEKHPRSNSIGTASIDSDGTIQMYLQARGKNIEGHSFPTVSPKDSGYKYELLHLGPMKIGEQKFVLPYRENDPDAPVPPKEIPPPPMSTDP
jgi:tetratricopeptide (TPR) repeat protein